MGAMKTPGVYIVEKNAFPNSVVEVATAVPAFIGYTEKADNRGKTLSNIPWRISSMAEFHKYYGGRPTPKFTIIDEKPSGSTKETVIAVGKDKKQYVLQHSDGKHLLYYCMRLFFQNGGGPCYVVSVGNYGDPIEQKRLEEGIKPLIKEQEPTMVVIPETVRLKNFNEAMEVQQQVLAHCGKVMKNRFAILDVHNGDRDRGDRNGNCIDDFRNGLGNNHLKFGAAYYPWVRTTILSDQDVRFDNIKDLEKLQELIKGELELPTIPDDTKTVDAVKAAATAVLTKATNEAKEAKVKAGELEDGAQKTAALKDADTAETYANKAFKAFNDAIAEAEEKEEAANTLKDDDQKNAEIKNVNEAKFAAVLPVLSESFTKAEKDKTDEDKELIKLYIEHAGSKDKAKMTRELQMMGAVNNMTKTWPEDEKDTNEAVTDKSLRVLSGVYRSILESMRDQLNLLPPAAAMAGVYTMVDNTRGVWKAPANVSLNSVVAPAVNITHAEQEDLNVTTQGKSINAIRPFIGEGTLVWGARTLDGNSLDWRYINVRRTMIMLEESIRLASKAYVFENNDANTWVTMKSMIRNFLTGIWKRGGLAGTSPDDAFSVHVGLGETMTPEDILEGILKVTILVALIRPAEFIEITFQQQMQKS